MVARSLPVGTIARHLAGYVAIAAVGLGLLALTYRGLTGGLGPEDRDGGLLLLGEPVKIDDLQHRVVATGRMEPRSRVPVRSEVSGLVRVVRVEEGDRVRGGEPMFELDRERLTDRVNELRASLESRRAAARYDLVGRALLDVEQTRREHARVESLHEKGVLSRQRFEESRHALRLSQLALNDARAETAVRSAGVAQAEHLLRQAERDLERAVIRAPIDGLVVERPVDVGAVVADVTANGGTLLAIVADDRRMRLVAEVDENDIAPVRVGQVAEVTFDAFTGERFSGVVRKVSSSGTVDRNVSNFEVEIELPPDERLRVGMSADARIVVYEYRDVLVVPNRAIVRSEAAPRVRLRGPGPEGGFRLVEIREVYSDGFRTVVEGGVSEGDVVLVPADPAGS